MWYLHAVIIGTVERHHELFSFRTEEGIRYLSLHVEYVICVCLCINECVRMCVYVCVCPADLSAG